MFYLMFLNDSGNWVIECRSYEFDDLNVSIAKLLFNGYTIKVEYAEE